MCIALINRGTAVNLGRQKLLYGPALLLHPNPHPTKISLPSSLWGRRRGTIFGHREMKAAVRVFPFPSSSPVTTCAEGQDMRKIWLLCNLQDPSTVASICSLIYFPRKAKLPWRCSKRRSYPELNYLMGLLLKPWVTWSGWLLPDWRKDIKNKQRNKQKQ